MRKALVALTASCAVVLAFTTPATAQAPARPAWLPPGWERVPDNPPVKVAACGTQVTIDEVINHVRQRVTETPTGAVIEVEGYLIVGLKAADGRGVRLDASGPTTVFATEQAVTAQLRGRSLVVGTTPLQVAALQKAKLPTITLINGTFIVQEKLGPNGEPTAATVLRRPAKVTDACRLLHR